MLMMIIIMLITAQFIGIDYCYKAKHSLCHNIAMTCKIAKVTSYIFIAQIIQL